MIALFELQELFVQLFFPQFFQFYFCSQIRQRVKRQRRRRLSTPAASTQMQKTGKPPVIVIPGLIGSELVNKKTDETVWFNLARSKNDDLRLPISANFAANKDNLVAGRYFAKHQIPEVSAGNRDLSKYCRLRLNCRANIKREIGTRLRKTVIRTHITFFHTIGGAIMSKTRAF